MSERIIASTVGVFAVLASLIPLQYAFFGLEDFRNPAVSFWSAAVFEFLACAIAFATLGMGIRFLRFGWSGQSDTSSGGVRPVLLGIGFFFPGFVFSLPLTVLWARHRWPGDGQNYLAAMEASFYVGVAAAIICCAVLFKKRNVRRT
jgi:hypothetical protein